MYVYQVYSWYLKRPKGGIPFPLELELAPGHTQNVFFKNRLGWAFTLLCVDTKDFQ